MFTYETLIVRIGITTFQRRANILKYNKKT